MKNVNYLIYLLLVASFLAVQFVPDNVVTHRLEDLVIFGVWIIVIKINMIDTKKD